MGGLVARSSIAYAIDLLERAGARDVRSLDERACLASLAVGVLEEGQVDDDAIAAAGERERLARAVDTLCSVLLASERAARGDES